MPGGYRVSWAGMKVLTHDGSQHHGIGILSTVPASRIPAGVAAGRDEVLERALALVSEDSEDAGEFSAFPRPITSSSGRST